MAVVTLGKTKNAGRRVCHFARNSRDSTCFPFIQFYYLSQQVRRVGKEADIDGTRRIRGLSFLYSCSIRL